MPTNLSLSAPVSVAFSPDAHSLLIDITAQLNGIRNLAAEASDKPLSYLSGYELDMLLGGITEQLERAATLIASN